LEVLVIGPMAAEIREAETALQALPLPTTMSFRDTEPAAGAAGAVVLGAAGLVDPWAWAVEVPLPWAPEVPVLGVELPPQPAQARTAAATAAIAAAPSPERVGRRGR
jgi:hypothetical protein